MTYVCAASPPVLSDKVPVENTPEGLANVWVAASAGTPAVPFTTPGEGGGRFVRGMPWAGILGEF